MREEETFDEPAVRERLTALPHWRYVDQALERVYRTANFKGALMVTMAVGHLCEAAWHHPDLSVNYSGVTVRLSTHSAKGITAKDFALAAKIEDMIGWQPGLTAEGTLEGTPTDPKHAYIRYA